MYHNTLQQQEGGKFIPEMEDHDGHLDEVGCYLLDYPVVYAATIHCRGFSTMTMVLVLNLPSGLLLLDLNSLLIQDHHQIV